MVVAVFAAPPLGAYFLSSWSFDELSRMRRVDRIPHSPTGAAAPGEVLVEGHAFPADEILTAPRTGVSTLYYSYLIEKKDSEGDWVTDRRHRDHVPFVLDDGTGPIRVEIGGDVNLSLTRDHRDRDRDADRRHSEWRIDPGDRVTAIGFVERDGDASLLRFDVDGAYWPLLTQLGIMEEQRRLATHSVLLLWGGITCLSIIVLFLAWFLSMHRTVVFLLLASGAVAAILTFHGVRMMRADLAAGVASLERRGELFGTWLGRELEAHGLPGRRDWRRISDAALAELPEARARRIRRMRVDLARAIERMNAARDRLPERLVAGLFGVERLEPVPLSDADRALASSMEESRRRVTVHPAAGWGVGGAALALSILFAVLGLRWIRRKRLLEYVPTSPTTGVTYGLTELKGKVDLLHGQEALAAPDSGAPCVLYRYRVEKKPGKNWVTIESQERHIPFVLRDDHGAIPIKLRGAQVTTRRRSQRMSGGLRYSERRLDVGDEIYVLGHAKPDRERGDLLAVEKGDEEDLPFIVSAEPERSILVGKAMIAFVCFTASLDLAALALLFGLGLFGRFDPASYLLAALIGPLYLGACMGVLIHNGLAFLENRISRAWIQIDQALRKRADLIPELAKVVDAHLAGRPDARDRLGALRTWTHIGKLRPEDVAEAIAAERPLLDLLVACREERPEMQEDWHAARVVAEFSALVSELELMRDGYNDAVDCYHARLRSPSEAIPARLGGFKRAQRVPVRLAPSAPARRAPTGAGGAPPSGSP